MLFGVVSKKAAGVVNQVQPQVEERDTIVSEEDLEIRKVRDKRISRFREHFFQHTKFTVSLQNSTEGMRPNDLQIKLIEAMIQYYTQKKGKDYLKILLKADDEKYQQIMGLGIYTFPPGFENDKLKMEYLRAQEPLDYMNLVKTYTMFLQHISVLSSTSVKDTYVDEINDNEFQIKQHYDFLHCDLAAKALRYSVHDYIMKRMHKTIFGTKKNSDIDVLVLKLILGKQKDPGWVLTSEMSRMRKA